MDTELLITSGVVPAKVNRHSTYDATDKGRARKQRFNVSRNAVSLEKYLNREIVAWDGEGLNEDDGSHTYVLLASSSGARMVDRKGLSTESVLEAFMKEDRAPIHIGYGLSYDINMILKDLSKEDLTHLYKRGWVKWCGYYIQWRRGKSFSVSRRGQKSFLLYDAVPFFQRSFVSACDEYLGDDWFMRDMIIKEKANRGNFTFEEIATIGEYNDAELVNLVRLIQELRGRLHKVGIRIRRWDGPGAVAAAIYTEHKIKSYYGETPSEAGSAIRHAYAGGRFEILRKGHSNTSAYQYDIRSAYPSAMRSLPCLAHGTWTHVNNPTRTVPFGVYRVEVIEPANHSSQPQPLWMRNRNGTVFFSDFSHGWYWTPEVDTAMELGGSVVHEGWEWNQECDHVPFDFVEGMYNKRAALKKAGDGAQLALKLGLNSLYGKLAQQIGWTPGPPLRLPPYHCLEWAGYITAHCRANVFKAAMQAPDDVIAFETDAVFMRVPLDLSESTRLGDWDSVQYRNMTYLKSGMYWAEKLNGEKVEKSRGINKGSISRDDVINAFSGEKMGRHVILPAEQTRFITLGQALHQDFTKWRKWITAPRDITVALNGKRIDSFSAIHAEKYDGYTETQEGFSATEFSYEFPIAWLNSPDAAEMHDDEERTFESVRMMQADENGYDHEH